METPMILNGGALHPRPCLSVVSLGLVAVLSLGAAAQDSSDPGRMTDVSDTSVRVEADADRRAEPGAAGRDSTDAAGSVDKSRYTLFNPTPDHLLRPLSTDRPDTTESPYTLDAGRVQVELSFFEYGRDAGGDLTEFSLLPFNLKVGLTHNVDLQFLVAPYVDVDIDDGGPAPGGGGGSGFAPVVIRAKFNLWGNDGGGAPIDLPSGLPDSVRERFGDSAFALMPYVSIPTGSENLEASDEFEFGIIVPLTMPLNDTWSLATMVQFDFLRGDGDGSYKLGFVHTASVGRNLGEKLAGYWEYVGAVSALDSSGYAASLGVGMTYACSDNVQLDGGINVGITDDAEDFRIFTGISFRI